MNILEKFDKYAGPTIIVVVDSQIRKYVVKPENYERARNSDELWHFNYKSLVVKMDRQEILNTSKSRFLNLTHEEWMKSRWVTNAS